MKYASLLSITFLSTLLLIFSSCKSEPPVESDLEMIPEPTSEELNNDTPEVLEIDETKVIRGIYVGYIGLYEKHVVMDLIITGDQISGTYFYSKHQKPLTLSGTFDQANNLFKVYETYNGVKTGYMEFTVSKDGKIDGVWKSKEDSQNEEVIFLAITGVIPELYTPIFKRYEVTHDIMIYNGEEDEPLEATSYLVINKIDEKYFSFYLSVIGGNAHVGSLEGLGTYDESNNSVGSFTDGDRCTLHFKFNENTVEIMEDNCGDYHGAHAYFEDTFTEVK
ncbi:MAG: hypothetical protein QNK23_08850 [Crocinitomicaceae bacterium]|nr:hypothetical protein [Crocinitomicaceae bacterium]